MLLNENQLITGITTDPDFVPVALRAAQRIENPPENPLPGSGKKSRSRRNSYNFIAEVVEEVKDALVYIEIKDMGSRDYYTGVPMTSSNGSGFVVAADDRERAIDIGKRCVDVQTLSDRLGKRPRHDLRGPDEGRDPSRHLGQG